MKKRDTITGTTKTRDDNQRHASPSRPRNAHFLYCLMTDQWTVKKILDWTARDFAHRGIDSPRLEAELLLAHTLGCQRIDLYLAFDRPLEAPELAQLRDYVSQRRQGTCTAYITGEKEFWSLPLYVTPDVLVPRPDTETLVEQVLLHAAQATRGLDMCTGSGCIAIALATELPNTTFTAVDISADALAVAQKNIIRHDLQKRIAVVHSDLFDALPADSQFDLIVANPPYVTSNILCTLSPEVQAEPRLALEGGGDDGMKIIERLLAQARRHLRPGGQLFIEMDPEQTTRAATHLGPQILGISGTVTRDLAGRERVVRFALPLLQETPKNDI